ncbi:molybdopterin-guanine dinucleotide biosynthesis protein B [Virgibacillus kekensis]|uniref:Molybdopterin-guanine dinucleotide biosynthesis protein B n=1 Tax=Virgibacillus kekensis TaxID=202261 RepID=A0ABV9DP09_9BACI
MNICQVVGYKNSGKTTLMTQLIKFFSDDGVQVASLKHHGHGGEPSVVDNTDSHQHMQAGSLISGVQGEQISQFTFNTDMNLDRLIELYRYFQVELLLVEGYKKADYPKVVIVRTQRDLSLLDELSTIIAVVTWEPELRENVTEFPVFDMDEINADIARLADCIRRCLNG